MIWLASDHAGYDLKKTIVDYLEEKGIDFNDLGCHSTESTDYPPLAHKVARLVANNKDDKGILLCKSGQGMAIAANRHSGVRASVAWNQKVADETREDNDSNIISIPAGYLINDEALKILETWLNTPFSKAERHERRIKQIDEIA